MSLTACVPRVLSIVSLTTLCWCAAAAPAAADEPEQAGFKAQFLTFCDLATMELNKEITPFGDRDNADPATHHMPFFEDAHAARALAVAYDMTGNRKYLDACKRWSDQVIAYQNRMIPQGAYYMNHSRAPGQDHGQWTVADSGCVGMGSWPRRSDVTIPRIEPVDLALAWMAENQKSRGADVPDYLERNVDMAGLPYLMYAFARQLPQHRRLVTPADQELRYIGNLLLKDGKPNVSRSGSPATHRSGTPFVLSAEATGWAISVRIPTSPPAAGKSVVRIRTWSLACWTSIERPTAPSTENTPAKWPTTSLLIGSTAACSSRDRTTGTPDSTGTSHWLCYILCPPSAKSRSPSPHTGPTRLSSPAALKEEAGGTTTNWSTNSESRYWSRKKSACDARPEVE